MASNLCMCCCISLSALLSLALPALPAAAGPSRQTTVHLEKIPDTTLKAIYLSCTRVSSQRLLSQDEAFYCSSTADILMRRSFGGDFNALVAWWRQHRQEP